MATYSITEDKKFPWVSLITITCENEIDVSSDIFNITVKDQLEYFISDYIKNGSTPGTRPTQSRHAHSQREAAHSPFPIHHLQ